MVGNQTRIANGYEMYIMNELSTYNKSGQVEPISPIMYLCSQWYNGYVEEFHKYRVKTGFKSFTDCKKLTLRMAKKVSEDWADLLVNEKCKVVTPQSDLLDDIMASTHTLVKLNSGVEKSFALGYGVMVQGVKGLKVDDEGIISDKTSAYITNNFVPATSCRPLTFIDNEVEDIAFIYPNTNYITIVLHIKDNRETITFENGSAPILNDNFGKYDIISIVVANDNTNRRIERKVFKTGSNHKLFQVIKPNITNNYNIESPLGISVFANSTDNLKAIDNVYDSLNNEIQLGRKKVVADIDKYTEVDSHGNKIETFDPNDILIYSIPSRDNRVEGTSNQFLQDISGDLRIEQIVKALNQQLSIFSSKCGLGENYYRYDNKVGITTATQIISENSSMFRTMKKHELLLTNVIKEMVQSIIYLNNTFTINPLMQELNKDDIIVQFDDSIIEDTKALKESDRLDVQNGLMSPVEYRMKYYGEDEEQAKEELIKFNLSFFTNKAESLIPLLNEGVIDARTFVKLAYSGIEKYIPNYSEEEFITRIEENIQKSKEVPSPFDFMNDGDE